MMMDSQTTPPRVVALRVGILLACLVIFGVASCRRAPEFREESVRVYPTRVKGEPTVRVQILDTTEPVTLGVTGGYTLKVTHLDGRVETGSDANAVTVKVAATSRGVQLGKDEVKTAEIIPVRAAQILVNGSPMPGSILFAARPVGGAAKLRTMVRLGLEEYLAGVLPNEMSPSFPLEALRAQAVASRSYALYHIKTRADKSYDVKSTIESQVWKPSARPHPRILKAVQSTTGVVLLDTHALFPAFFHSQCGERTADADPVFLKERVTALTEMRCPYCGESGESLGKWQLTLTKTDLSQLLREAGLIQGDLDRIRPLDRTKRVLNEMGRVYYVEITQKNGVALITGGNEFRLAVGAGRGRMESTWCSILDAAGGGSVLMEGRGFGHGVGMCQIGAKYMAGQGNAYDAILKTYYFNAQLVRLYGQSGQE